MHIVKEEYEKTMNEIRKEYNFKTQLIKTAFHKKSMFVIHTLDIRKINDEINDMLLENSIPQFKILTTITTECTNLEYKICAQIQNECEQYWMHGLL